MNRSERRRVQKEQNKEAAVYNSQSKWLDNLLPWQKAVIETMLREAKVDTEIEVIAAVDKILTGVLIERTDMSWKETFDFNTAFGKYYAEYRFITSKIGKEKRLKMLQGLETEVILKVENLIIEGKTRGQIVKSLMADYKDKVGLTTPEANNVYKRTHEKYKLYVKELEAEIIKRSIDLLKMNKVSDEIISILKIEYQKVAEQDLRGIFIIAKDEFMKPQYEDYSNVPYVGDDKSKDKPKKQARKSKKDKTEVVNHKDIEKGDGESITVEYEEVKEEVKEDKKDMSNLKVVKEVVKVVSRELEGEFGKYVADENGVKREDTTFKNLEEVEKYKKEQLEKFEREIAELEAVFAFREQ